MDGDHDLRTAPKDPPQATLRPEGARTIERDGGPHVVALRHVHFEDLGRIEDLILARGGRCAYLDVGLDDITGPECLEADLVVILGGPIGVNDTRSYPYLEDEIRIAEYRLRKGLPLLGICLGAQVMARALGARVRPALVREIGWGAVRLTGHGEISRLSPLKDAGPVFHWHGDEMDLPEGALRLAETDSCPVQAFSYGETALALQFHLEIRHEAIERWLIGNAAEAASAGVNPVLFRQRTAMLGPPLERYADAVFDGWFDAIGCGEAAFKRCA